MKHNKETNEFLEYVIASDRHLKEALEENINRTCTAIAFGEWQTSDGRKYQMQLVFECNPESWINKGEIACFEPENKININ